MWEKYRTAKTLNADSGVIEAQEGKRFLTAASEEHGVVVLNSSGGHSGQVISNWRAAHYFSTEEAISLTKLNLPMVSVLIDLQTPVIEGGAEELPGGFFQIGYFLEGQDLSSFTSIGTVQKDTDGWKTVEFDFSSAPKDKKIHLSFAYVCGDSRKASAPGLQIDNIKIFDDGL